MGKKPAAKAADNAKKEKEVKVEAHAEKKPRKTATGHVHLNRAECHCKVKGCKREYRAKGYCGVHYKKWRQGEFGLARYKTCTASECRKPMVTNRHGFCEEHYQSFYVKGVKPVVAPAEKEVPAAAPKEEKAAS